MRIALFTDTYFPQANGVTSAVEVSSKELNKRGHKVKIVVPSYPNQKYRENIIHLRSVKAERNFNFRLAILPPDRKFLRSKIDLIHGHGGGLISMPMGLIVARFKKIPFVFTYHTLWRDYTHYLFHGVINKRQVAIITKRFLNMCNYVIAPSEKVKKILLDYGVKKPIAVIPSGIETDKFKIKKKYFLRKKFKLEKTDKILLFVGRLGKEKSIDFLLYVFAEVLKKYSGVHFVVVGNGPQKGYLENLAKKLKIEQNVHFFGGVEYKKMPLVYNDADIFIFASTTETQGLVVLEAMASGLPIVAVDDSAIEETITDKVNGILVGKDVNEFADAVLKLVRDKTKRKMLGKNARKKAVSFSEECIIKLENIYKEILKKN